MIIGKFEVKDDWELDYAPALCKKRIRHINPVITKDYSIYIFKEQTKYVVTFPLWSFPKKEYLMMYPQDIKYFDNLKDAKKHVDEFLIKLSKLKSFL